MVIQKILSLLYHFLEERSAWVWPISLHVFNVGSGQGQNFCLLDALNAEVASILDSETIPLEAEFVVFSDFIMNNSGNIYH